MKTRTIAALVIFPLWFAAVFFVGAHLWLAYEASASKAQNCKALADEVGITVSFSDYKKAGCPGP